MKRARTEQDSSSEEESVGSTSSSCHSDDSQESVASVSAETVGDNASASTWTVSNLGASSSSASKDKKGNTFFTVKFAINFL
jgi:hypothetical protein